MRSLFLDPACGLILSITAMGTAAPLFIAGVAAMGSAIPLLVATFVGSVIAMIPVALAAIIQGLGQLALGIVDAAPVIGEAIVALGLMLCQIVVTLAGPLGEAAAVAVVGLIYGISKGLWENIDILTDAITMFFAVVTEVVLSLLENILSAIPVLGPKAVEAIEGIKDNIDGSLDFTDQGVRISDTLSEGILSRTDSLNKSGEAAAEAVVDGAEHTHNSGKFGSVAEDIAEQGVDKINGKTPDFGLAGASNIAEYIAKFQNGDVTLDALTTSMMSGQTDILNAAKTGDGQAGLGNITEYISQFQSGELTLDQLTERMMSGQTDILNAAAADRGKAGIGNAGSYIEGFSGMESDAENAGAQLAEHSVEGTETVDFQAPGTNAGGDYVTGIETESGHAHQSGSLLSGEALKGVQSNEKSFKTSGENAGSGFLSGLGSFMGKIRNKAAEIASNALSALNSTLDERSPSKETAKSGEYFVLGFTNELDQNGALVRRSASTLAKDALSAFNAAVETMDALPDDGFSLRITPVLDADSLRGIGTEINSQLSAQRLIGVRTYAEGIQQVHFSMSEFDADNRNIVEALRTLHEDMADLQNEVGQMQIVLDTGALVGGMVGQMDVGLGRQVNYARRGM